MNLSDVATCYFKYFKGRKPKDREEFNDIISQARYLVKKGWTISNITNRIVMADYKEEVNPGEVENLRDIPYFGATPPLFREDNLLEDRFYYHPELQKVSGPVEINIKLNGGIEEKEEEFYLEMEEVYTLEDLLDYFMRKTDSEEVLRDRNKNYLKKYLSRYDLEHILFAIDAVASEEHIDVVHAGIIANYLQRGKRRYKQAKNYSNEIIYPYYRAYFKNKENQKKG